MASNSYKAKAPGSLMLCGEHAVLYGKPALVCAINKYLTVELVPTNNTSIKISSDSLGEYTTNLNAFVIKAPFTYVLTAIEHYLTQLPSGCTLYIKTEFSDKVGFGSSAAITVATLAVLELWLHQQVVAAKLYQLASTIVKTVQGSGSGADIAASLWGGIIQLPTCHRLFLELPLVAIYSGSKNPSRNVIQKVAKLQQTYPVLVNEVFATMATCTQAAYTALQNHDLVSLGELFNIHHGLQDALGVNNAILAELIFALRSYPTIFGAKISGAGLGDCVIGLGSLPPNSFSHHSQGVQQFALEVSSTGVTYNG